MDTTIALPIIRRTLPKPTSRSGALITDREAEVTVDETLLVWGGEFGRTPTSEGIDKPGRDHDWHGFSMWLAGAGVKGGQAIGRNRRTGI
ncbi:MAG: DUF1501 domain-containing protein [Pirellulaceae bacterium]